MSFTPEGRSQLCPKSTIDIGKRQPLDQVFFEKSFFVFGTGFARANIMPKLWHSFCWPTPLARGPAPLPPPERGVTPH
jgi:hypothetical protein